MSSKNNNLQLLILRQIKSIYNVLYCSPLSRDVLYCAVLYCIVLYCLFVCLFYLSSKHIVNMTANNTDVGQYTNNLSLRLYYYDHKFFRDSDIVHSCNTSQYIHHTIYITISRHHPIYITISRHTFHLISNTIFGRPSHSDSCLV